MNWRNSTARYGSLSIGLHWLMLLLLAAVYACVELRGNFPKGSDIREGMKHWHYMLGLSVFALAFVRAVAQSLQIAPSIEPAPSRRQQLLAKAVHLGLYAVMFTMPLLGWLALSADGKPIPFFGFELPALVGESEPLAEQVEEIHEAIGTLGYFLIGIHAAAALYHHYFMRDNTLKRMLPQ